jgi:hypothetical protein
LAEPVGRLDLDLGPGAARRGCTSGTGLLVGSAPPLATFFSGLLAELLRVLEPGLDPRRFAGRELLRRLLDLAAGGDQRGVVVRGGGELELLPAEPLLER